ncbi:MAG: ligand-binding sensor domain-containing protein [Clostridium chrysemydis]|uniref:ligand-binding sensor domain-containing protein n=1 Tax=Clostridium chrysemydis TaxID=2665504 RepID=UPI003F3160B4
MNKRRFLKFCIIFMVFITFSVVISEVAFAKEKDKYLKFKNLTINNGLSQGSVYSIYQDEEGYMWFGTNDGLNRYDGYNFTVIKGTENEENTLWPGIIGSIVEDRDGYLWIGSSSGLSKLDRKTSTVQRIYSDINDPKKISNKHIWDLFIDSKGNLWIGTENGLNKYDSSTGEFKKYFFGDVNSKTLSRNFITGICEGIDGTIWVGTKEGLNKVDINSDKVTRVESKKFSELEEATITKLYRDTFNNLWIGTQSRGIFKYNLDNKKFDDLKNINKLYGSEKYAINSIYEDLNGDIWIGSKGGLIKYSHSDGSTNVYTNNQYDSDSLVNTSVQSIYRDREGLMWIGTYSGISILNPNQYFINYKKRPFEDNSLSGNSIGGIYEDKDGTLWIGTNNNGLNAYNKKTGKVKQYTFDPKNKNSIPSNTLFQVTGDSEGNIWVATKDGMASLDPRTDEIKRYYHLDNKNSLIHNDVRDLYFDKKGQLWIGTRDGLDILDPKTGKFTNLNNIFIDNNVGETYVRRIFEDSKGNFWFGMGWNGGLIKYNPDSKKVKVYKNQSGNLESLSNNAVKGINEDKNGFIWATTSYGICKLDPKTDKFTTYTEKNGLANDYTYGILIDNYNNLWISTNGGLSKFNQKTETFDNYTVVDGLQSNEFNGTAEFKNKDGEMYFGGINGVTAFFPDDVRRDAKDDVKVTISSFKVYNNNDIKFSDDISLKNNENTFSIEFFKPYYSNLGKSNYEYMLEGFDKDWIYSGQRNYVSYTNLPSGHYKFKVRTSNGMGEVSDVREFKINIKEAWYKSKVAYVIYLAIICAIVFFTVNYVKILGGLVRVRTIQLNKELVEKDTLNKELIKAEEFRNTYIVNLSHELRTPLNVILSSEQLITSLNNSEKGIKKDDINRYMGIIKMNSNTLLKVINDLIDSSKIKAGQYRLKCEKVDIVYLLEEVALSMKVYIEENGLDLIIDPDVEEKTIVCDPTEIERCIINLISNAVKFTPEGGSIYIGFKDNGDTVDLIVKDTGIGISKENQNVIFDRFAQVEAIVSSKHCSSGIGLTLVKNLVELHNGKISVESEEGKGSKFIITLPVNYENKE